MTKRIKFISVSFGNSEGDVTKVELETEKEVYYYDGFDRYCYLEKSLEGIEFEYTQERSNYRVNKNG